MSRQVTYLEAIERCPELKPVVHNAEILSLKYRHATIVYAPNKTRNWVVNWYSTREVWSEIHRQHIERPTWNSREFCGLSAALRFCRKEVK